MLFLFANSQRGNEANVRGMGGTSPQGRTLDEPRSFIREKIPKSLPVS